MELANKLLQLGILSFILHYLNNIDIFKVDDTNWKETDCVGTYGAWSTIEGCKLISEKVSPYTEDKKCWIHLYDTIQHKYCEIIFKQPLKIHYITTIFKLVFVFLFVNILLGGYLWLAMVYFVFIFLHLFITIYYEYYYSRKYNEKMNFQRVLYFLREVIKNDLKNYK